MQIPTPNVAQQSAHIQIVVFMLQSEFYTISADITIIRHNERMHIHGTHSRMPSHTHTHNAREACFLSLLCVCDINLGQILDPTKKVVQQGTGSRYTVLQGRQQKQTDRASANSRTARSK